MKKCCFTQIPPVVHVLHHIYISGNRPEVGTNRKDDGLKDCKNAASLRRKVGTIQIFLGSLVIVPAYAKNRTNFRVHPPLAPYFCRFLPLRSHFTQKVFASHRHSLPLARYLNKLFLILKFSSPFALLSSTPVKVLQSPSPLFSNIPLCQLLLSLPKCFPERGPNHLFIPNPAFLFVNRLIHST